MSDLLTSPLHLNQPNKQIWLPLYTSTNQINKYNNNNNNTNNNNNKEKELALLSQSGHSSYHIYIYKCFFFSFLLVPKTIVLFWHDDKTKKSTISNQDQAPDMLLQKNTIWHVYFTSVIITPPTYTITFCYIPKLNSVNLCNTYN